MAHIVKRKGHREAFDERKVYASCYAACRGSHMEKQKAEKACEAVCRDVRAWIKSKKEVTSTQLFSVVGKALQKRSRDAAFMYTTHRDLC